MPVTLFNHFSPNFFDSEPLLCPIMSPNLAVFYFLPLPLKHKNCLTLSARLSASLLLRHTCWVPNSQSAEGVSFSELLSVFIWVLPGTGQGPLLCEAHLWGCSSRRRVFFLQTQVKHVLLICLWQLLLLLRILTFSYMYILFPCCALSRAGTTCFCVLRCLMSGHFDVTEW